MKKIVLLILLAVLLAVPSVMAAHNAVIMDSVKKLGGFWYSYDVFNKKTSTHPIHYFEVDRTTNVVVRDVYPSNVSWLYTYPGAAKFSWTATHALFQIAPSAGGGFGVFSWAGPTLQSAITEDTASVRVVHTDIKAPDPTTNDAVDFTGFQVIGEGLGYRYSYQIQQTQGDPLGISMMIPRQAGLAISDITLDNPAWTSQYVSDIELGSDGNEFTVAADMFMIYTDSAGLSEGEVLNLDFFCPFAPGSVDAFSEGSTHVITGPVPEPATLLLLTLGAVILRKKH